MSPASWAKARCSRCACRAARGPDPALTEPLIPSSAPHLVAAEPTCKTFAIIPEVDAKPEAFAPHPRKILRFDFVEATSASGQARCTASLRPDVCRFDDLSPFIHLGAKKGGTLIRRRADHHDAALFELSSDRRLGERCDRVVVNFPDDVPRRLGGDEERRP